MKTVPKSKETTVKDWYNSLPANKQADYRRKIMEECEFSHNTFYRVLAGDRLPTRLEREAITRIAGQKLLFDLLIPHSTA